MPITISNQTGDGVGTPLVQSSIEIPDSGTSVLVSGQVQSPGSPAIPLTGSPVAIPAVPGAGATFYILQANTSNGAVTVKQSSSAVPSVDAGSVLLMSQSLVAGQADPALDQSTTPDS